MNNETSKGDNIVSLEKQYELMYNDAVSVSYEVKRSIFELSRWVVTLQGLVIGGAVLEDVDMSSVFVTVPVLIGLAGLVLNIGFQKELNSHRKTLAILRRDIGGAVTSTHSEHINAHLYEKRVIFDYWNIIKSGHIIIILFASLIAVLVVADSAGLISR